MHGALIAVIQKFLKKMNTKKEAQKLFNDGKILLNQAIKEKWFDAKAT